MMSKFVETSEHKKRARTFIPIVENPPKRRPGRPRKEEHLVQNLNLLFPQSPPSHGLKSSQYFAVDPSDSIDNGMVGLVVTGIIEGSFEAGYFISVRTIKTGTLLRGVVFQPGLYTPVNAANDIAPNVRMYKRRDFPIPDLIPQPTSYSAVLAENSKRTTAGTLVVGRSTYPMQNLKSRLKKESASPQLKSGCVFPLPKLSHTFAKVAKSSYSFQNKNTCASAENKHMLHEKPDSSHQFHSSTIPPTSNLLKDNSGASTGGRNTTFPLQQYPMSGKEMPQRISKSALDNKLVSQSKSDTTFPLPNDHMLRGNNLSRQNSDSRLPKQSSSKSKLDAPFSHPRRVPSVTLTLTESLSKKNDSLSVGGKEIPQHHLKLSLDKRAVPQLKPLKPFASKVPMANNLPDSNSASSSIEKENQHQNSKFFALTEKLKEGKIVGHQIYGFGKGDVATPWLDSNKVSRRNSIEGKKTGQQNYGFELGDVSTPRLDSNRLCIQSSLERNKTRHQNCGFGLGDISTPRLDSNKISVPNSIEGKKTGRQNHGFRLGDVTTPRLDKNTIAKQNGTSSELSLGMFPENLTSSENETPHELLWYEFHGNQKPATDAADNIGVSQSKPQQPVNTMKGITSSDSGLMNIGGSFQLFP